MNALESTKMFKTLEDELQNITEYWKNNAVWSVPIFSVFFFFIFEAIIYLHRVINCTHQ